MAAKKKSTRGRADVRRAFAGMEKASKDLELNLKKIKATFEDFFYFIGGYPVKPKQVRRKKGR